jgi:glycosyltransferase involved in cell wall biosynthesis
MNCYISIIMNCYNGEKYLTESLKSVIRQKYKNWELIFWDNRSTDNSSRIFKSFKDRRFKYFLSKKHTTLYKARNLAYKKAKGEFVAFIDCDDLWYPNFLSERKDFFQDKNYKFSYSNFHYHFQKTNRKVLKTSMDLKSGLIYNFLAKNYLVAISSLIIKNDLLKKKKKFFNEKYNIIGDFDAVMKISKNFKAYAFQKSLLLIRIHGENFLDINRKMFFKEFKNWFLNEKRDNFFNKNKNIFLKKLLYLYLVSLFPKFIKDFFKKK